MKGKGSIKRKLVIIVKKGDVAPKGYREECFSEHDCRDFKRERETHLKSEKNIRDWMLTQRDDKPDIQQAAKSAQHPKTNKAVKKTRRRSRSDLTGKRVDVDLAIFLNEIFPPDTLTNDEAMFLFCAKKGLGFPIVSLKTFQIRMNNTKRASAFHSTSTFRKNEVGQYDTYQNYLNVKGKKPEYRASLIKYRHLVALFVALYCVVLDDVGWGLGSKVSFADLPTDILQRASWIIETSPGNYQLIFLLDTPIRDVAIAERFVRAIYDSGHWDAGGTLVNKAIRLPCGVNDKDKYKNNPKDAPFKVGCPIGPTYNRWSTEDLLEYLGASATWEDIQDNNVSVLDPHHKRGMTPYLPGVRFEGNNGEVDVILEYLMANDLVVNEDPNGVWHSVLCPWASGHTDGTPVAGYSPLGALEPGARVFNCFHDHCKERTTSEYLEVIEAAGGPSCAPSENLVTDLVSRYLFDIISDRLVDFKSELLPFITVSGFQHAYPKKFEVPVTGKDGKQSRYRIPAHALWMTNPRRVVVHGRQRHPGQEQLFTVNDDLVLNTWSAPPWGDGPYKMKQVQPFIDFVEYLLPDAKDAEWFLDHLAMKIHIPAYRGLAIIMTTPIQGTGRDTLFECITRLWGKTRATSGLNLVQLADAIGGVGSFNRKISVDWIYIGESDGEDKKSRNVYPELKGYIVPNMTAHYLNEKGIPAWSEMQNSSLILASQDANALHIPTGDRRFVHLRNTVETKPRDYYSRLRFNDDSYMNRGFEPHVWRWLKARDLTHFDPDYTARRKISDEEALERSLLSESEIKRAIALLRGYVNAHCQGLFSLEKVLDWLRPLAGDLKLVGRWEPLVKTELQNVTRDIIVGNALRGVKFKTNNIGSFRPHYFPGNVGSQAADSVINEGQRGNYFEDCFLNKHIYGFSQFVKAILEA